MNPLQRLEACGQSPWLDNLKRSLVEGGALRAMIDRDGLKGLTSNPSIFEKAIGESDEYADAIQEFMKRGDHRAGAIYEHLAIADIKAAADVLGNVYRETQRRDGYVSLECSPHLANDTEATVAEGLRLWNTVQRSNLMVKVPATPAGIPAIQRLIAAGVNVNVTLLFSVDVYEQAAQAYIAGLEEVLDEGGDVSRIASVASFFVSRIDTEVDRRLDKLADQQVAKRLRGKAAIANAKIAYERYGDIFSGQRWHALAQAGARTQRLLWASTGVKNPAYRDTVYVEELVGPDTVNTMPPATMDAVREHGDIRSDAIRDDLDGARKTLSDLHDHGIALDEITTALVDDGVKLFADAFDKLLSTLEKRRLALAP